MSASASDSWEAPQRRSDLLYTELESSWLDLARVIDQVTQAVPALGTESGLPGSLREARERYERETRLLLVEPVDQFLRLDPIRRSLDAMEAYDQECFTSASHGRRRIDSHFQKALAQAAFDVAEPWRIWRRNIWRRGGDQRDWIRWRQRCAARAKECSALLDKYAHWARVAKEETGDAKQKDKNAKRRYATWRRQDQGILTLLEAEVAFRDLSVAWFTTAEHFVESARGERDEILSRARQTLEWIQVGTGDENSASLGDLKITSPQDSLRAWSQLIENLSSRALPERTEIVLPSSHPRWRVVAVREVFLNTYSTYAEPAIAQVIGSCRSRTSELQREVSRAQEIIHYWSEVSAAKSDESALLDEARHNAAAMLAREVERPQALEELDEKLVRAFQEWNEHGSTSIEAAEFGQAEVIRRRHGRGALDNGVRLARQKGQEAARRAGRWSSERWDRALELFGGKIPDQPTLQPVVRRTTLRDTLSLAESKRALPGLYDLLFRIAPVEDRRFLVGREQELAGLDQAVKDWEAGRFAACLVVGDRGSGKTSLLNCAERSAFCGHKLVRGEFGERAVTPEKIDAVLRELLGVEDDADLLAAFAAQRQIVVIEECERIFLRKPGGFEGTHYLLHLVHRTAPTTLWVVVMNDKACRVLDAGVELHRVFSHRINAMNVSRSHLEKAILERHRLSGLRLQFAPPPAGDARVSRAKQWLGLEDSAQKLYFDSLFQQSAGVFRSAFELWLSSIERVEGEEVRIRQPLDPAFSQFRSELAQEDHFTLLAIQEHGSLTHAELAEVLSEGEDLSRSRMERLFALGLIESDPEHPGMRVRPEAQRFTNDMLRRANLT